MNDRTQLAGMVLAGMWACPEDSINMDHWGNRVSQAVSEADVLLAELAKTAKPEAAPTIEEVTEGRTMTVYPCPKCGETDPEAKSKTPPHRFLETTREAEDRANKFQASYDHLNKAWNYNINKWSKIIDSRYCYDEPEVILDIDRALEQGVKDAARVKELEAEVQRQKQCRERSIRLMGAKINRQRTQLNYFHAVGIDLLQARAEKAEAALQTARAEGAKEERERVVKMLKANHFRVFRWDCSLPMGVAEFEKFLEHKP